MEQDRTRKPIAQAQTGNTALGSLNSQVEDEVSEPESGQSEPDDIIKLHQVIKDIEENFVLLRKIIRSRKCRFCTYTYEASETDSNPRSPPRSPLGPGIYLPPTYIRRTEDDILDHDHPQDDLHSPHSSQSEDEDNPQPHTDQDPGAGDPRDPYCSYSSDSEDTGDGQEYDHYDQYDDYDDPEDGGDQDYDCEDQYSDRSDPSDSGEE